MDVKVTLDRSPNAVGQDQRVAPVYCLYIPNAASSPLSAFPEAAILTSQSWHRGGARNWADLVIVGPEHMRLAEENAAALVAQRDALRESQARSRTEWQAERNNCDKALSALRGYLAAWHQHSAVRALV